MTSCHESGQSQTKADEQCEHVWKIKGTQRELYESRREGTVMAKEQTGPGLMWSKASGVIPGHDPK